MGIWTGLSLLPQAQVYMALDSSSFWSPNLDSLEKQDPNAANYLNQQKGCQTPH